VVGAGISGLFAAAVLAENGRDVTVCEARERVGGRLRSLPAGDGAIDLGATWFWPNEPMVRSLTEGFAVPTYEQRRDGDALLEVMEPQADSQPVMKRFGNNPLDVECTRFSLGAEHFAQAVAGNLPEGTVRLGEAVDTIAVSDDGVRVVTQDATISAEHVIVAVPPALALDRIDFTPGLPGGLVSQARLSSVWMSDMVKAVAVYDEDFWHPIGLAAAAISHVGPFREFHDHSGPAGSPAAIFGFAPAGRFDSVDDGQIAEAFIAQLRQIFGDAAAAPKTVEVIDWSKEAFTNPAARIGESLVEANAARARETSADVQSDFSRPISGRIHWASTETADAFAGHIEGALRAGLRAARQTLGAHG
jgi:monoamine oxidase